MVGFVTAPSIAWGTGALEQLSGLDARRAFVVVDPAVARHEAVRRAVEELERGGARTTVSAEPRASPTAARVRELAGAARSFDPDWIVAIGGGTTIDAAKALRLLLARPELDLERRPVDVALPGAPGPRLCAVPTTSGSGAEASWAVDLVGEDGAPFEVADRSLVPDWALVDPFFARELPADELVAGAFETAALATEAYLSAWANPFSDALAADAVRQVVRRLSHALRWSDDPDARAALHYAATAAGLAHSNAQRGLAHALARALERPTALRYGRLLAIVLPSVLDFDRSAARERLETLQDVLRPADGPPPPPLPERLRRLAASVGVPLDLAAAGVDPARLREQGPRIVAETLRSPAVLANPRVPNEQDVRDLLERLLGGAADRR